MGVNNQKLIQIVFHGFSTSYPQNVDNLFFYPHFAFCVSWR